MNKLWMLLACLCCGEQAVLLITLAVIAPSIFDVIADRSLAGATFGRVLRTMTMVAWPLVIMSTLLWVIIARILPGWRRIAGVILALLIIGTHLTSWLIQSHMEALREQGLGDPKQPTERRLTFHYWHKFSEKLVGGQVLILLIGSTAAAVSVLRNTNRSANHDD